MKKILTIGIMLLFVGIAIAPTSGIDLGKQSTGVTLGRDTLYVGGTGSGNYSTIQEAIDDANDGDTVFVYSDSSPYYENVVVNKSINLIGEDKDSTVIDGNQNGDAVYISADWVNISGFTIQNTSNFVLDAGIELISNHSTISGNNIVSNNYVGITLDYASYNTISGNFFYQNKFSIILDYSGNNTILNNDISYNDFGITLGTDSSYNIISNNHINGIINRLIHIGWYCNNINVTNNILYGSGEEGIRTYGSVSDSIISGNIINNCDIGIYLLSSNNCIVDENIITNCGSYGIYSRKNDFSMISNNDISSNYGHGISLRELNNNYTISNNHIKSNEGHGLYIRASSPNGTIFDNNISSNEGHGIYLKASSSNSTIFDNTIKSNNGNGIYINGSSSDNIIIYNNVSLNNGYGMRIENYSSPSKFNIIYHNNFINNTFNGYDNCKNNTWDNGYPSGGNYWSDYSGVDVYRGPNQNIPGSDSIGDTPKNIYGYNSEDYYPLMYPWGEQRPVANYTYLILGDGGILFNGSSSYDYEGVVINYEWDFDDGNNGQGMVVVHAYNESGTYNVTLTVTDDDGYQGSYTRSIDTEKNHPPSAPLIDGPIEAKAWKSHFYNFTSEDPEEADVSYYIEWGDGKITSWCDFLPSGETYRTNHGWAKGTYKIRCKAKDIYGAESDWSELEVTMPKSKPFNFNFNLLSWLFERFPHAFPILRQFLGLWLGRWSIKR